MEESAALLNNRMSEVVAREEVQPAASSSLVHNVARKASFGRKIWIDLDNSPHVPFFAPIIEELERAGCSVLVTARDCFQVCELADLLHLEYRRVGHHYGKNKVLKLTGLCWRALQLLSSVVRYKPQLALSHGSRS
jgi:predicted glycosyltransferase